MSELSPFGGSEGYGACGDDAASVCNHVYPWRLKKNGKKPACGQAGFLPGKKERRNAARLTELAQGSARAWEESRERGIISVDTHIIPT